jgi:hypothetical protein
MDSIAINISKEENFEKNLLLEIISTTNNSHRMHSSVYILLSCDNFKSFEI